MNGSGAARTDVASVSRRRIAAAGGVWHKILQVRLSATEEEVRRSFRTLALLHHPDKNGGADDGTFKLVLIAYNQALRCCKPSQLGKPTKTSTPIPKPARPAAAKAATQKSPRKSAPKAKKGAQEQETTIPKNVAPQAENKNPQFKRARSAFDTFKFQRGVDPEVAVAAKRARAADRQPSEPTIGERVMYVEPEPAQPMPCAREVAIHACKSGDLKSLLLQRLFALQFGPNSNGSEPAPVMPVSGLFKDGVKEYMITWGTAISREIQGQIYQEASRVTSIDSCSAASSPMRGEFIHEVGWSIELLTGFWNTKDERDRGGFHISSSKDGKLWISNGDRTWTSPMQRSAGDEWASAYIYSREVRFRPFDWNTLEVSNGARIQRSPDKLQDESIVLISGPSWRDKAVPPRIGIVKKRHNRPVVCAAADVAEAFGKHLDAEIRVVSVGLIPSVRELQAVKGVQEVPRQLLSEILGSSPPTHGQGSLRRPADRGPLPCLRTLNESQLRAIETAGSRDAGFSLIWGPPGTGKSATLLRLVNALHVQEYERMHKAIEDIALGRNKGSRASDEAQWYAAVKLAPRILVTANSNAAVEGLIERVRSSKFLDRQGNMYEPWGMVRVGTNRGECPLPIDLDTRVNELLDQTPARIQEQLESVRAMTKSLNMQVVQLRNDIRKLQEVLPLPHNWEAKLSLESGMIEFHDHNTRTATYQRPEPPPEGSDCVRFFDCKEAMGRLVALIGCAEKWLQYVGQEKRLALIVHYQKGQMGSDGVSMTYHALRQQLERSFLDSAHVVFSTLSSAARLVPQDGGVRVKAFGAVIIDEAAQATEPATLVPLQLAHAKRCVLVGDDRQLPPTVFAPQAEVHLTARSLFERLRIVGHRAELLELQYRMSPHISAFPRAYFYGGVLRDAPGMEQRTVRRLHGICPPLLFVDLASSEAQRSEGASWRNWEEARVCAKIVAHLCGEAVKLGEPDLANDVGVITGYRAQQEVLKQALKRASAPVGPDVVRTVDGYQGRECEIIVVSAVRAPDSNRKSAGHLGFLADDRRLNVAITRAKSILVVVGHAQTLSKAPAWAAFLDHVRKQSAAYQSLTSSGDVAQLWRALDPEF